MHIMTFSSDVTQCNDFLILIIVAKQRVV